MGIPKINGYNRKILWKQWNFCKKNGLCSKLHRAEKTLILNSLTVFYTDIIYIESTEGLRRKTNVWTNRTRAWNHLWVFHSNLVRHQLGSSVTLTSAGASSRSFVSFKSSINFDTFQIFSLFFSSDFPSQKKLRQIFLKNEYSTMIFFQVFTRIFFILLFCYDP